MRSPAPASLPGGRGASAPRARSLLLGVFSVFSFVCVFCLAVAGCLVAAAVVLLVSPAAPSAPPLSVRLRLALSAWSGSFLRLGWLLLALFCAVWLPSLVRRWWWCVRRGCSPRLPFLAWSLFWLFPRWLRAAALGWAVARVCAAFRVSPGRGLALAVSGRVAPPRRLSPLSRWAVRRVAASGLCPDAAF